MTFRPHLLDRRVRDARENFGKFARAAAQNRLKR